MVPLSPGGPPKLLFARINLARVHSFSANDRTQLDCGLVPCTRQFGPRCCRQPSLHVGVHLVEGQDQMTQSAVVRAICSVTLLVFSASLDPRNTANADTEPVLVTYQESNWTDTASGTESTPSITWQAADVIVVVGATEDSPHTLATPTAPGLTFSLVNSAGGASNVNTYLWSAVAGGNGSGAVSSVKSSASAAGIAAFVYRGSTGIGNNATITGVRPRRPSAWREAATAPPWSWSWLIGTRRPTWPSRPSRPAAPSESVTM